MGTLYECLKEARLEKYYEIFRINGITRSEATRNILKEVLILKYMLNSTLNHT